MYAVTITEESMPRSARPPSRRASTSFHAMPAAIAYQENGCTVTICTTGRCKPRAKVLIDATGDANAVHLAGLKWFILTSCNRRRFKCTLLRIRSPPR